MVARRLWLEQQKSVSARHRPSRTLRGWSSMYRRLCMGDWDAITHACVLRLFCEANSPFRVIRRYTVKFAWFTYSTFTFSAKYSILVYKGQTMPHRENRERTQLFQDDLRVYHNIEYYTKEPICVRITPARDRHEFDERSPEGQHIRCAQSIFP